ncbi:MAG TPA: YifB family Mg chelatase-like AAA ATPase, partial [Burkholderiales bacterium]|nr:YifB family Mg chelatase-like AAA ATPase [Burkholderiales bacterium]
MSLSIVHSRAQVGLDAPDVTVEVHITGGLPALSIVGLPEAEVKESKDRVRSAIINSRFEFPARRITVNLAPADLPKEGGRFDLPIALGILAASGQIPSTKFAEHEFVGELALTGVLRPVRGALPIALAARHSGRALIVPVDNADEAALARNITVLPTRDLLEATAHLGGTATLNAHTAALNGTPAQVPDITEVRGQHHAKRALEVAAAGGHSLLMIGPPGAGKTMLASRLPGILPPMTDDEALEAAAVQSLVKGFNLHDWGKRPFRAPHHTASSVALVGGSSYPRPGEISLAHHGVLFLDELPEFDRHVLETLREPLESGTITISRAARQAEFPACFQFVAAMNPCPCGHFGDATGRCQCSPERVRSYRARLSGPLLDRIDMHIEVPAVARATLLAERSPDAETSAHVRTRVEIARAVAMARSNRPNARLGNDEVERVCALRSTERAWL